MKVLVFIGAARKNGATRELVDMFLAGLSPDDEIEIIDCYRTDVAPCLDCRYCWKNTGCAIKDDMQDIYAKVEEADAFVMAAPMYFHTVPGKMKILIDRFQTYWAGIALRKDHKSDEDFVKKGVVLMTGGAPSFPGQFQSGEKVLTDCLVCFESRCAGIITVSDTDHVSPSKDKSTIESVSNLLQTFHSM